MDPSRFVLTDCQWRLIEALCPGGLAAPGRTRKDTRLFLEAVLWIVRTNAPCRDLSPEFGNRNSTFRGSGVGVKLMYSNGYSTHSVSSQTWNMRCSVQASSKFTGTGWAQLRGTGIDPVDQLPPIRGLKARPSLKCGKSGDCHAGARVGCN